MDYSRIVGDVVATTVFSVTGYVFRRVRRYKARLEACESDIAKICRIPEVARGLEEVNRIDRAHTKGWVDE